MFVRFKWIGGATWVLELEGLKIACDPVLCPSGSVQDYKLFKTRRLDDPEFDARDFDSIDLWLITHGHEDHIDDLGRAVIKSDAHVVTHKNALGIVKKSAAAKITVLQTRDSVSLDMKGFRIEIEAIPAVHGVNPLVALAAGGVNGYWITVTRNKETVSFYVTSDTVAHSKVLNALQGRSVDILIPYMGAAQKGTWMGTLTLSAAMLRKIMGIVQPRVTLPVHFGSFEHYREPISEVTKWQDNSIVVLQPGQTYEGDL